MTTVTTKVCENPLCQDRFVALRSDARYCSSACRQQSYRERRDTESEPIRNTPPVTAKPVQPARSDPLRPVPVTYHDWEEERFWTFSDPWGDHPSSSVPSRMDYEEHAASTLQQYVHGVACIGNKLSRNEEGYPWDLDSPLPDEMPNDITPEVAEHLAAWLEPALDRVTELLGLLKRRSHEDPAEFPAPRPPATFLVHGKSDD
jgi:hypothetical protein